MFDDYTSFDRFFLLSFQLLTFMYGWLTFYHQGHEVATDFKPHMLDLQSRIQKVRAIILMKTELVRADGCAFFCSLARTSMQVGRTSTR